MSTSQTSGPTVPDRAVGSPPPDARRRSRWLVWLSLVLAAALFYFAVRGLDWWAFWTTIRGGHFAFVLLVVPIASIAYFVRSARWRVLVRFQTDVPLGTVFWANMIGYMGNAFLPARAGELMRSAFLGQQKQLGTSYVLATALSERILDAVTLVLIGVVCLLTQGGIPASLSSALMAVAAVSIAALVVFMLAPSYEALILRLLGKIPMPGAIRSKVMQQANRFLVGMRALQDRRRLLGFFGLTAIIWTLDGVGSSIGARIISQDLRFTQALVLLAALGLSSALPSTPGYVGVYQFVAVTVLPRYGFSRENALAYILIGQALSYLVVSFWGLLGFWRLNARKDGTVA